MSPLRPLRFILLGILFGVMFTKAEVISWYRIQEMFHFASFHMYGVIGSAVVLGAIGTALIKRWRLKDLQGNPILFQDKQRTWPRYLLGGTIFGLGWALTGACPGPLYTLIGAGHPVFVVVLASALAGTWAYGALRDHLPH
ncbi:MAG: DUF6691 family protein [Flavobacteriales bacterium]